MPQTSAGDQPAYPSRRSLRTPPQSPVEPPEFLRVPLREHVPTDACVPASTTPARPVSVRRRLLGVAAAASACGLMLTAALPLVETASGATSAPAAARQELFSEVSAEDLPPSLTEITAVTTEEATRAAFTFRANALVNFPFAQPVLLTDPFGYRTAPVEQFHDAQDFGAAAGTPIQSIANGKVLEAGMTSDGCGFGLKLEHAIDGKSVTSRYCHMEDNSHSLKVGDTVKMGDPVGKVGATGMAFGAHLHLAIRVDDSPTDPMLFLTKYNRMDQGETSKDKTSTPGTTS